MGGVDALLIAVAARTPRLAYLAALCAVAGSVGGSAILFGIARKGGEVFLTKHISRGTGRRLHAWFLRYGLVTVFIPAASFVPLPMKVPVFCAGTLNVRWASFLLTVLAARVIRYFTLAYLAQRYGAATFTFLKTHAIGAAVVALLLAISALAVLRMAAIRGDRDRL